VFDINNEKRLLDLVEQRRATNQREISSDLGISLGKTHYLISSLVNRGLIKIDNFRHSKNKKGYVYLLTPKGVKEKLVITREFLRRKEIDFNRIRNEIKELRKEIAQNEMRTES
jgi:EPS-associated MarR family transcriptional regulator